MAQFLSSTSHAHANNRVGPKKAIFISIEKFRLLALCYRIMIFILIIASIKFLSRIGWLDIPFGVNTVDSFSDMA